MLVGLDRKLGNQVQRNTYLLPGSGQGAAATNMPVVTRIVVNDVDICIIWITRALLSKRN